MISRYKYQCLLAITLLFSQSAYSINLVNQDEKKLDFYGTIIARRFISNNVKDDGDRSYLYFGLIGKRDITKDWQAYANWEYTVSISDSTRNATRLAYLGVDNLHWGSLDIGRNWGLLYDVTSLTDRSPLFREMSYNYIDNFMRGRALNLITWRKRLTVLNHHLKMGLQYQFKSNNEDRILKQQNGNGVSASLSWSFTPELSAIFSASSSATTFNQQKESSYKKKINTYAEGVSYNSRRTYLAAVLTQSNNAISPQSCCNNTASFSYEVLAKYMLTETLQPNIGYTRLSQTVSGNSTNLLDYEEVGFSYHFNRNLQFFADYKINNARNNITWIDRSNKLDIGISYHW